MAQTGANKTQLNKKFMKSGPSSQNRWKIEKKGNFYSDKFLRPLTTSFNLTKILVIERFPLFDFIISLLLKNRKSAQNKKKLV